MNLAGLFATACIFAQASDMMKDADMLLVPHVVNGSFACELYIKGLLMLQEYTLQDLKNLPNHEKHSLSKLYDKLNESTKVELKDLVTKEFTSSKQYFESYLNGISTAFTDWRYNYENQCISVSNEDEINNITFVINDKGVSKEFLEIFISCLHNLSNKELEARVSEIDTPNC